MKIWHVKFLLNLFTSFSLINPLWSKIVRAQLWPLWMKSVPISTTCTTSWSRRWRKSGNFGIYLKFIETYIYIYIFCIFIYNIYIYCMIWKICMYLCVGLIVSFDPRVFEVKIQRFKVFIFRFFFFFFFFATLLVRKSLVCEKIWICWDSCRYEWHLVCKCRISQKQTSLEKTQCYRGKIISVLSFMLLHTALAQAKQETPIWFEEMVRHAVDAVDAVMQCSIADFFEWSSKVVRLKRGVQVKTWPQNEHSKKKRKIDAKLHRSIGKDLKRSQPTHKAFQVEPFAFASCHRMSFHVAYGYRSKKSW